MSKHIWFFRFVKGASSLLFFVFLLISLLFPANINPVKAEGSRELVASGGKRALTEWRVDTTAGLYRRTFFRVYARAGENILMGSSAMGLGLGDIILYQEGQVANSQITPAALAAITPTFTCSVDGGGAGVLRGIDSATTRSMEIVGATTNGGADGGYIPCVYTVPAGGTGTYWVAMYGPLGVSPAVNVNGDAGTIAAPNITLAQQSGVSVWDITVRAGNILTGTNRPGRVFVDYLAQITGGNGVSNQVFSNVYAATSDGYVYQVDLNGLDPFGYILYGNRIGFLDPDGTTPLYHDVVTNNNQLNNPAGGVTLPPASARMFFSNPLLSDLPASILPVPIAPTMTNVSYIGSAGGVDGYQPIGGQFTFTGNVGGVSEIVISQDGLDFQPDNPLNRVIRSQAVVGANIVNWDGRDNTGAFFPVGNGYKYHVTFHAGEYHFPLIDAENSPNGGPSLTLLNPVGGVCPFNPAFNCHTGFYDDRGYRVSTGTIVGTVGATLPGAVTSINPPATNHADNINGFDTSTAQRAWGDSANSSQSGFGNWKALDLWTYIPVGPFESQLNVINQIGQDLRIVKSHSGDFNIGAGGGSFNITVSNAGTTAISAPITVTDTLPAGLTPVTAATPVGSGWNACTIAGQLVTCVHPNGAGLAVGASLQPITLTVDVSLATAPGVINTVSVSNPNDTNPSNNQYSDPVTIASADIAVEKSVLPVTVREGDTVTFTIRTTNNGPSAATGVQLDDVLPPGLTYVSHIASQGTYDSLTGIWAVGALPNTAFATLDITATVDVGTAGLSITNTATRSASSPPDYNPANDTANALLTVINPVIQIVKSPASQMVIVGSNADFTLTVTNPGDVDLTNVVVTDVLCNIGPTLVSGDANTNNILETTETWVYSCTVNNVAADFTNNANVSGLPPIGPAVTAAAAADVNVIAPAIQIVKSPALQTVVTGSNASFTLTVTNPGDVDLTNVVVTDALCSTGPTLVSGDVNTNSILETTETWIYGCTVNNVTANFTNSANVSGTPPVGPAVTGSDTADVVVISPAIQIVKSPALQTVVVGGNSDFTLTVTNPGDVDLTNVVVTDVLCDVGPTLASGDANTNNVLETTETWVYSCTVNNVTADFTNTASVSGTPPVGPAVTDIDTATVNVIAPAIQIVKSPALQTVVTGSDAAFTLTVTNPGDADLSSVVVTDALCTVGPTFVSGDANTNNVLETTETWVYSCTVNNVTANFTNTANVSGTPPVGPAVTDIDTAAVNVIAPAILIVKTPVLQTVVTGSNVDFTLTVTNPGNADLTNVVVTDALCSAGPTLVSGDVNTNNILETTETWIYSCTVNNVTADFKNTADVSGTPPVGPAVTDNDTADVIVISPAIQIVKTPPSQIVAVGSNANFTLTVTNTGNVELTNVVVTDALCTVGPAFVSGDANINNILETTETWIYSCAVNNVTANFTNTAGVSGTPPVGPVVADTDSAAVTIEQVDLSLTKTVNNSSPKTGDAIIFTITITNQSLTTAATNVVVDDVLPAGLTFNSAIPSIGTFSNITGDWTIATLAANTSATLQLNATVTQVGVITNTAEIIAVDQFDIDSTPNNHNPNEDDQASVSIGSLFDPPSGIKSFSEAGLPQLEFRLVWINSGNTTAINTQVTDNIPAGTVYVDGSVVCVPQGTSANAGAATVPLNTTVTNSFCAFDPINNRVQWQGSIGPDNGNLTEAAAANEIVITFRVTVNDGVNQVLNFGSSRTDTDGDTDFTEETVLGTSLIISNQVVWNRSPSEEADPVKTAAPVVFSGSGFLIPVTGFTPDIVTELNPVSRPVYDPTNLTIKIPSIKVNTSIVGVEQNDEDWDVSWLQDQAGWLSGTAYPTWKGNSVLTAHVVNADGKPGVFFKLKYLKAGEYIFVYNRGYRYSYKVVSNEFVQPDDSTVLKHEDKSYLTLITCDTYDEETGTYLRRVAVRAVLVDVREIK